MIETLRAKLTSADFLLGVGAGVAAALGLLQVPGLVVESQECSDCRVQLAVAEYAVAACDRALNPEKP